jgi:site-specific DNA recombinase
MRWNHPDQWVTSKNLAHRPLIEQDALDRVQEMLIRRARTGTGHQAHRSHHPYIFKSLICCGVCGRKLQGQHSYRVAFYRCRYPQEYALTNKINHPAM